MGGSSAGTSDANEGFGKQPVKTKPKTTLQKVGDFVKGGGVTGMVVRAVKGSIEQNRRNQLTAQFQGEEGPTRTSTRMAGGESDNRLLAKNVGGKIVKLTPTSAEISQSNAADVTYDERKTKSKGRTMTILTSTKGVRKDEELVLCTRYLLGRA